MTSIDEIMELAQSYSDSQQHTSEARNIARAELRHLIAAALADAERKGAEAMRESSAVACGETYTIPIPSGDVIVEVERPCYPAGMTADNIRALPLPTGERQAVLLTDEQIDAISAREQSAWWTGDHWCCEDADWYPLIRSFEVAVLAANNLEVRRG